MSVHRVRPTLEKSLQWIKKSAPVTLARTALAVEKLGMNGRAFVHDLVDKLLRRGFDVVEEFDRAGTRDSEIDLGAVLQVDLLPWMPGARRAWCLSGAAS